MCASIYRHVNTQFMLVADMFALYNLWPALCLFFDAVSLRSVFLRRWEPTFQGWPLAMWGPRQGQRGSNAGIVLHAQHAFSLLAVRHGTSKLSLSELNSLTGCVCMCQHVRTDADIILDRACVRKWSARYGFVGYCLANLLDVNTERGTLLFQMRW